MSNLPVSGPGLNPEASSFSCSLSISGPESPFFQKDMLSSPYPVIWRRFGQVVADETLARDINSPGDFCEGEFQTRPANVYGAPAVPFFRKVSRRDRKSSGA